MNRLLLLLVIFTFSMSLVGAFMIYTTKGQVQGLQSTNAVRGMIVPHHNLAKDVMHDTYSRVKAEVQPALIVLIGPNHFHQESPMVTTGKLPGDMTDIEKTKAFASTFQDTIYDEAIVAAEHSMTTHLPYIKEYFPDAKVLPLIFSTIYNDEEMEKQVEYLKKTVPPQTLFIASVDFSHETLLTPALEKNKESIRAIEQFDYKTIFGFEDDHMDSPVSIAFLLKLMESQGSFKWETWHSTHGALILDDPSLRGTSYVTGVFR